MEVLAILAIVFLVVTLVGHGIWVVIAALFRGSGQGDSTQRTRFEPTIIEDRAATARYLEYLRTQGMIDDELHAEFLSVIAAQARTLPWRDADSDAAIPE